MHRTSGARYLLAAHPRSIDGNVPFRTTWHGMAALRCSDFRLPSHCLAAEFGREEAREGNPMSPRAIKEVSRVPLSVEKSSV